MSFTDFVADAKQAVSILSNPRQSSVIAASAAGGISAAINNFRQDALGSLEKFQQKNQILGKLGLTGLFSSILQGSENNPIPAAASGRILGLTYLQAILAGISVITLGILVMRRK